MDRPKNESLQLPNPQEQDGSFGCWGKLPPSLGDSVNPLELSEAERLTEGAIVASKRALEEIGATVAPSPVNFNEPFDPIKMKKVADNLRKAFRTNS